MLDDQGTTDAVLVAETLAGNREAFGRLYDRYARLVRAVVRAAASDEPTMHDLAQDCFLRAYRGLGQLREPDKFGPWLVTIARQVASESSRRRRRDGHRFVGTEVWDVDETPDHVLLRERAEEWQAVLDELARLPERERLAVHAFFLEERDAAQTAELLNLSRSGVYGLLARACSRLASRLGPRFEKGEIKS
jgi:RNA polymerase sigma-70 factor, ECF subfamily